MRRKKENGNFPTDPIYPAVLHVTGEETRRWCAAIWSVSPGEQRLVDGMRSLIEGTLMAHWMQPPAQYEPTGQVVNSFDALFYESLPDGLSRRLAEEGWASVSLTQMPAEEYEQFEVLEEEARKAGRAVSRRPAQLWRLALTDVRDPERDWSQLTGRVARGLGEEVWGENPGWFSRAYCQEIDRRWGVKIWPDKTGLRQLTNPLLMGSERGEEGLWWVDPMSFQALCDFLGVVLQSETQLEVQWGMCPVDEQTGLAPAPLLRARAPKKRWRSLTVAQDVMRRVATPWGRRDKKQVTDAVVDLIDEYEERCHVDENK